MDVEAIKSVFFDIFQENVINIDTVGGMTNNNYLVTTDNKKYILKLFGKGTEKLISREIEKKNLKIIQNLNLDVENYVFDIKKGIMINEYIDDAITFDDNLIKEQFNEIAEILKSVHSSNIKFYSKFDVFDEILKYENLINSSIPYAYYEKIKNQILTLKYDLEDIGVDKKSCHIDLVPENFIKDKHGRIYLIDWEYCAMNDPMWDLAALFLESNFSKKEEAEFLNYYKTGTTPINFQKILIYKILQDFLWSLWTVYKEEQGSILGTYGIDRYNRMLKNLKEYKEIYEK